MGLANFTDLLSTPLFLQVVKNTLVFLAVGGLLLMVLSLAVSIISVKGDFLWQRWALLLPMVIPVASLSLGWNALWGRGAWSTGRWAFWALARWIFCGARPPSP